MHVRSQDKMTLMLFIPHFLSFSGACVCPSFLSSVFGGDPTEEPTGVARRTLPASGLWSPPPHSYCGTVSESADPPPCSPLSPPPLPSKTADPLQHLYSTTGQVMNVILQHCWCVAHENIPQIYNNIVESNLSWNGYQFESVLANHNVMDTIWSVGFRPNAFTPSPSVSAVGEWYL